MPSPFQCQLGRLVTVCLAEILVDAPERRAFDPVDVHERVSMVCARHPLNGNQRRALQIVFTRVMLYLRRGLPPHRFRSVESEVALGRGRADLLWVDGPMAAPSAVLVDELKSSSRFDAADAETIAQVRSYLDAGIARWPGAFAGVRLVSLLAPDRAQLFSDPSQLDALGVSR